MSKLQGTKSKRRSNALTPIQRVRNKLGDFVVFDIESNNWSEFVVGGIYDGETFTHYTTCSDLVHALSKFQKRKIFAHFGGIFDFLFVINELGLEKILDSDLIMRGSSVFAFNIDKAQFYDSSGVLPFSLEKAAKSFGVKHQKQNIDHTKKKKLTPELLKYLEHDCRALYESIEAFYQTPILKGTNFKPTLASQSLEVLRKYIKVPIPSINSEAVDEFVRLGYAGGRVEIFRPIYDNAQNPIYYYDFNSLYPSVMRDMDVPGAFKKFGKSFDALSFVDCEVECPKEMYLPLLWQKQKLKFIFPTGKFRGVFPGSELIEAEKQGYTIHKVFKSAQFENLGPIFREYIDDLYKLKQYAPDPIQKQVAKLLLNAGYGRMGIKRNRESLTIDDGSTGITPLDVYIGEMRLAKKQTYYQGFSNAAIAAHVTAHARLKLFHTMKKVQGELFYCDTDSIVTTAKLPTGEGLGELKLEGFEHRAAFLLPKTYIFGSDVKMKGFPKEFAQSKNFTDFKNALEGELSAFKTEIPARLSRIKSARKLGHILKVSKKSPRQLKALYDKRILIKNGSEINTEPLFIK